MMDTMDDGNYGVDESTEEAIHVTRSKRSHDTQKLLVSLSLVTRNKKYVRILGKG